MSPNPLRAARGTTASITSRVLKDGEFAYNTDTDRLHVGDDATLGGKVIVPENDEGGVETRLDALEDADVALAGRISVLEDIGIVVQMVGDGVTDCAAIMNAAVLQAQDSGLQLWVPPPAVAYGVRSTVNFGGDPDPDRGGVQIHFLGECRFRAVYETEPDDSSDADYPFFKVSSGAVTGYSEGNLYSGRCLLETDWGPGLLVESAQAPRLEAFNVRGAGAGKPAFDLAFCISGTGRLIANSNQQQPEGWWNDAQPGVGVRFRERGVDEGCAENDFFLDIGGTVKGVHYVDSINDHVRGAVQRCDEEGVLSESTTSTPKIELYFEANGGLDMSLDHIGGEVIRAECYSDVQLGANSVGIEIMGGVFDGIEDLGTRNVIRCKYNRSGSKSFVRNATTIFDVTNYVTGARERSDQFPRSYRAGLAIANNSTDAANDIDCAAGACRDSTNTTDIIAATALTKRIDAAWAAGDNQGGLDTGSVSDGVYHVFAIKKDDDGTADRIISASQTAPTLPTGYTKFRRIGSVIRVSGAIVPFKQRGNYFGIAPTFELSGGIGGPTEARTSYALTRVPTGVGYEADVAVTLIDSTPAAATYAVVNSPLDAAATPSVAQHTLAIPASGASVPNSSSARMRIATNASAEIAIQIAGSTGDLILVGATHGWWDDLGDGA